MAEAGLVVVVDEPVGEGEGVQEVIVGGGLGGLIESVSGGGEGAFEEGEFLGERVQVGEGGSDGEVALAESGLEMGDEGGLGDVIDGVGLGGFESGGVGDGDELSGETGVAELFIESGADAVGVEDESGAAGEGGVSE